MRGRMGECEMFMTSFQFFTKDHEDRIFSRAKYAK
jgi:hypothetical protein